VLSRSLDVVWTARTLGTLQLRAEGDPHVGDHQTRATRLKDAGRRQKLASAGGFPDQLPFSHNRRREMINELDRLMTIADLSEMLSVPVDSLYG
jgi:hypothetical protein